jgi:hypothetical protein
VIVTDVTCCVAFLEYDVVEAFEEFDMKVVLELFEEIKDVVVGTMFAVENVLMVLKSMVDMPLELLLVDLMAVE